MYITKAEGNILKRFLDNGDYCFTYADVQNEFPEENPIYLSQLLSGMVKKGSAIRLAHGIYYIVSLTEDTQYFIPDWHLVAKFLMKKRKYYIGYYSAFQIHNLITQPSLAEYIVTDIQIKNNRVKIRNIDFQYVYHNNKKFFGFKDTWINNHDKVKCSDLEKTFVDCLINTSYAGGILEIGKALYKAKEKINYLKIWEYFERVGNKAAMKRFGFLSEVLNLNLPIKEEIIRHKGNSVSLLDLSQPDEGKIYSRWGLKINFDIKTLEQGLLT